MLRIKEVMKENKKEVRFITLFAIFSGISIIGQAYLLVLIIEKVFLKGAPFAQALPLLTGLFFILAVRHLSHFLCGKIGIQLAAKVKSNIRKSLIHKHSHNSLLASLQGQSGKKVSVLLDTVDKLDSYYSKYLPQFIQIFTISFMILLVIFWEHWTTGIIILATAPFIPIFMMIIGFKTRDKSEEQLAKMSAFSGQFLDALQGINTLKLFGQSNTQKKKIQESSHQFKEATISVLKIAFQNSLALEFISMLSIGLIALEVAFRMIVFQNLDFFPGFLMLLLAPEFFNKLKELGSAFHLSKESMGAAKIIEEDLAEETVPVNWGTKRYDWKKPPEITLEDVTYRYNRDRFALKNIQIHIHAFENIAVIGKTGSGKTTLLNMLAGLLPNENGQILVNGDNRESLQESDWFSGLSYISQFPYIFSGTIAENIAIGSPYCTEKDIQKAGEKAGLSRVVQSMKDGYHTQIGEGGRGLSGGEMQRIALARAFLKQPTFILFDEPTTGLDIQTEQILQASIMELSKTSTVVTIAHRLYTINQADIIFFMEDGEIIASGNFHELMKKQLFRNMLTTDQGGAWVERITNTNQDYIS
ncbi:thiol reductant ABC exporter subunit CydD [Oceanobacillus halophilus]|uniref:Thiol reductant ABC exporter subunit CydD n=1 Tax=Oceanobacillus halophilus TaxID=930130 RepID=A0A494ZVB0_9BACI|nr:thiol reductant ABC exporter subunit CydD [Oceanobacillus halophilus]RKQ30391.1 thiol reductant ABC exporter subunit CydD [Oceanobacillus halophilus]